MVWDTTKIVIIPIAAGLLFNSLIMGKIKWLDKLMPVVSMAGIGVIIVVITAAGRDSLLKVGLLLVAAVFIHNAAGYTCGYWLSRLLGFKEKDCRTISLEVGMQNAGLASGLALLMGGMATIGLAPAIFGPLMNVSGSTLATWWHARTPKDERTAKNERAHEIYLVEVFFSPILFQNRYVNSIKNQDMNFKYKSAVLILFSVISALPVQTWAQKTTGFKVLNDYKISSPGGWDYITVDGANKRVYVSHGTQVNVISTTGDSLGYIPKTTGVHGIALVQSLG